MKVKSESEVAQSCPTLSDPMDCSLPGSSIHGIFQARVLEWGAIALSQEGTERKTYLFLLAPSPAPGNTVASIRTLIVANGRNIETDFRHKIGEVDFSCPGPFLKSFFNLLQYCFCLWVFF